MRSTCVWFLELEFERELEVALRIGSEISGRVDHAGAVTRLESAAAEAADESIGVAQVDMVEEVHRLDAELPIDLFGEAELLEERGVGTPIPWPTQRVVLLVSESSDRRSAEDAQVGEVTDCPVAITTGSGLDLAVDVR